MATKLLLLPPPPPAGQKTIMLQLFVILTSLISSALRQVSFTSTFEPDSPLTADSFLPSLQQILQCLEVPHRPQYSGGIILNPELNRGSAGWSGFGTAQIQHRVSSKTGNHFIVSHSRTQPHHSASQKVYLLKDRLYAFSAWLQVSQGNVAVTAGFKTSDGGFIPAGAVIAEPGCWSMLKGGITVNTSGEAELYFHTRNSTADLWVDSVSLQPFTHQEWRSHQDRSIEQTRKEKVRIQVVDKQGNPLPNANVTINQNGLSFPFGCAINKNILSNAAYKNWFTSRGFRVTTFENEMKWYTNEPSRGREDYSAADALLWFAQQHNVAVRGHNVLWDDPNYQQGWLNSLSPRDFGTAVRTRINSVVSRYKGKLVAWDVVNENLHFSALENKLGSYASALAYNLAYKIDWETPLFMNEYNTIEESGDPASTPVKYLQKLRGIRRFSNNNWIKFGIGLESHFGVPNLAYMRASIDTLAAANVPIWLTEVDVKSSPDQASYLEQVLREGHAHPKVSGMVVWAAWSPQGCYRMCLTDNNFRNLPTGDVVDKLLHEWGGGREASVVGETDANGYLEASLFHGDYNVSIVHPRLGNSGLVRKVVCLKVPLEAQYGGGMIGNLEGLYGIAYNRTYSHDSVFKTVQVVEGNLYVFSGWVQVTDESREVGVVFKTNRGELIRGGRVTAKAGCWSFLKGGIFANFSGPVEILFESKNTSAEIWIENVSLHPFTMSEWRSHQDRRVATERKSKVRFQVKYKNGTSLRGAKVTLNQISPEFPFGCGMNYRILSSTGYQEWFASRFKYTTFTNEMKWYSTEKRQGQENYTTADAMMKFAKEKGISVRGHNIFWDDPKYQPGWVRDLSSEELAEAAAKRIDSVVSRYAGGQLIAWDVMNENLHFSFFEDRLGRNASAEYFLRAHQLDPNVRLFMNEYNTIEYSGDEDADPVNYRNRFEEILSYPGNQEIKAGIGVQGHFSYKQPNLAYMRSSLDILASTGIPIWLTEVSIGPGPNQAEYLEQVLREAYSHPGVEGIIMFAGPEAGGFNETTLADKDFNNTAAGDVVDKLIHEWETKPATFESDEKGFFEALLFHGDYNISVEYPDETTDPSSAFLHYKVSKDVKLQDPLSTFLIDLVQTSKGSGIVVDAVVRTSSGELHNIGKAIASNGCWSMLKGGLSPNSSGLAEVSFQSKDPTAEVWVENVALQQFTMKQWRSHQDHIIEKFGCGMNLHILSSKPYRNWFASRFKHTTFTNAMKWYSTELVQGQENYTTPDAMLRFCKKHNISIRGHNVFWDNPKCQPQWVKNLTGEELEQPRRRG
ncbi:unnamed protein product [Linum tenue]|uniref:GH10 domain-containing protein n=1 Tax=Linum tenue TaxID=586396 RepID=A0AAV0PIB9_9ROSI|nr:unnamed protein product [Linum tenue]